MTAKVTLRCAQLQSDATLQAVREEVARRYKARIRRSRAALRERVERHQQCGGSPV